MAKMIYTLRWADGESDDVYTSRDDAMARVRARYPRAVIMESGYVYQDHPDLVWRDARGSSCWATRDGEV